MYIYIYIHTYIYIDIYIDIYIYIYIYIYIDCWRQLRTVHAMHCKLICQRIFGTVGDRKEGRDLNGKR